ncbi:hypothetical protein A3B26_03100 [Candidatus Giovannonibacteria bacterium RIFCSPLOWO2_01_FULL_48_47]|nr:MAG: hypothetical protein A3D61_03315 [Candidatus Giovannonibacteria bacterium RIFCSPHIGHO2_02_FULL_48_15]OGF89758.1 MAG: hypothetical protein A3B26_03100 [Candidatus Giovannonibacteria bacterium RIFCSPLOWO2_01_FULL_48_47]OGF96450.1 MAG: hypothetical protein A2613_02735 [Candidatus Giovannonibacteria bacterium RIFOXYD1_FULL_48_21]HBT81119.1 bifunctional methylenetetrahydrofolate dehydrogenase/methenyltetrahydrofolate cyclohydrolase [Candidatus Giovannonibacteria bacterium]
MIVDGKALAEKIKAELKADVSKLNKKIRLAVVKISSDAATEKFLEQKRKFAEAIGVDVRIYEIHPDISTNKLREKVSEIVHIKENNGVIVQLPLPPQINTQYILDAIVPEKDPDMLSSKSWGAFAAGSARRRTKILPPVAGAVKAVFDEHKVEIRDRNAVVIGAGRLVGKPLATWLLNAGATVSVIHRGTKNPEEYTRKADIIISGVGKPKLITPVMVKDGVVAIDCGTSESPPGAGQASRQVVGDIDPGVSEKASLFAPVPGGVGPVTVAMLFKNLVELSK